jgi:type 2A phosphatase activator TIP41
MPTSFFVLARFSLRVDGVLFRLFDTRIYHSFASSPSLVVRETSGWECKYDVVKSVSTLFLCALTHHVNFSLQSKTTTSHKFLILFAQALENPNDLTPLADPNFVHYVMSNFPRSITQDPSKEGNGAGTGWRGLGTTLEILEL